MLLLLPLSVPVLSPGGQRPNSVLVEGKPVAAAEIVSSHGTSQAARNDPYGNDSAVAVAVAAGPEVVAVPVPSYEVFLRAQH
jgi:hypothetical protein